ncbi:hypothetical protein C8A00DRAFT_19229 [Chaetomidium leptoderma]|uniref:Uncharacterized protein n=1 Tax=Chaetomidium leptoderma TaxID=669021 RepID=A0AAN6VEH9_9PEZI|nr:hypothetical protein C8A00DRAFT_19229 [Chaetomidium leptoderma]
MENGSAAASASRATHKFPCKLEPPCDRGNHGFHITWQGEYVGRPIGKYYFTEDALKHDLAALKKGEVYDKDEFYKRAKSWYKAEIDRLIHLERVKATAAIPAEKDAEPSPVPVPATIPSSKDQPPPPPAPIRVQPSRAAKRKAAEPPPTKRPPPRKRKAPAPTAAADQRPGLPSADPKHETIGDYSLAAYDWAQFLNGNRGEHRPSPWSYVQLQGMDVAYFCVRMGRAVRKKVEEIHLVRDKAQADSDPGAKSAKGEDAAGVKKKKTETTQKSQPPKLQIEPVNLKPSPFRCALIDHEYPKPTAPFEPAAALAPGEDWRPPRLIPPTISLGLGQDGDNSRERTPEMIAKTGSWAAEEVSRRRERERKAGQQAPEAEMEISPTLGRWRRHSDSEAERQRGLPVEDLVGANVVEVSGLRFAVDVCSTAPFRGLGVEEGVRFLML